MRPPLTLALLALAIPATGNACADVAQLIAALDGDTAPAHSAADTCGVSTSLSGDRAVYCLKVFPYRSAAARAAYAGEVQNLTACFPDAAEKAVGPAVNHPDSYDLHQIALEGATITVSLKDKAARGQSILFLRVEPR